MLLSIPVEDLFRFHFDVKLGGPRMSCKFKAHPLTTSSGVDLSALNHPCAGLTLNVESNKVEDGYVISLFASLDDNLIGNSSPTSPQPPQDTETTQQQFPGTCQSESLPHDSNMFDHFVKTMSMPTPSTDAMDISSIFEDNFSSESFSPFMGLPLVQLPHHSDQADQSHTHDFYQSEYTTLSGGDLQSMGPHTHFVTHTHQPPSSFSDISSSAESSPPPTSQQTPEEPFPPTSLHTASPPFIDAPQSQLEHMSILETSSDTAEEEVPKSGRPQYPCLHPNCDRVLMSMYTRQVHMMSHKKKPRKAFKCTMGCDASFTRQHDRQRHEVILHNKECKYVCQRCERFFSSQKTLDRHTCRGRREGAIRWPLPAEPIPQDAQCGPQISAPQSPTQGPDA